MMTFEEFEKILTLQHKHHVMLNSAYALKIDFIEAFSDLESAVSLMWKSILTKDGHDWLEWFLYEKDWIEDMIGRADMNAWDENQVEICQNLQELYNYLKQSNYFKV